METDWKKKIENDFIFMMREDNAKDEAPRTPYQRFGIQISAGWEGLLRQTLAAIVDRFAADGIREEDIDFVPRQVKQRWGVLVLHYGFFGITLEEDDIARNRRQAIAKLIKFASEDSKKCCESCSEPDATLRDDRSIGLYHVATLCDSCEEKRRMKYLQQKKVKNEKIEIKYNVKKE